MEGSHVAVTKRKIRLAVAVRCCTSNVYRYVTHFNGVMRIAFCWKGPRGSPMTIADAISDAHSPVSRRFARPGPLPLVSNDIIALSLHFYLSPTSLSYTRPIYPANRSVTLTALSVAKGYGTSPLFLLAVHAIRRLPSSLFAKNRVTVVRYSSFFPSLLRETGIFGIVVRVQKKYIIYVTSINSLVF